MSFSNIIWTTVNNTSYAVSNTFICKHMINPGYKKGDFAVLCHNGVFQKTIYKACY